jgi:hypothetical protein
MSPASAADVNGVLRDWRAWLLALLALAAVLAVLVLPPLAAPPHFAIFADRRTLLGIPNFFDVVSNLPSSSSAPGDSMPSPRIGARVFATIRKVLLRAGLPVLALTGFGSAYYHLAPGGFMALVSAVMADRISVRAGFCVLLPLLAAGAGSVVHWRFSVLNGAEDVVPYAAVQYGAIAKLAELLDGPIYAVGGIISGHTLKHLLAAFAAWWLLRMLQLRSAA